MPDLGLDFSDRRFGGVSDPIMRTALKKMWLCVNTQSGQQPVEVEVLDIFKARTRIRAITTTILGGRGTILEPGEEAIIASWTLRDEKPDKPLPVGKNNKNPQRYYAVLVKTHRKPVMRYYRARQPSLAREQAGKIVDVLDVVSVMEITEEQFIRGRETSGQGALKS
jgi:hypothetical protein